MVISRTKTLMPFLLVAVAQIFLGGAKAASIFDFIKSDVQLVIVREIELLLQGS